MPGTILRVRAAVGDAVKKGQSVLVLEAMKMENDIVAPEDGATIRLVAGDLNQKVVCRVIGNPEGERLWWFVDGRFVGESTGLAPFAVALRPGSPVITCSTAEGVTATAHLTVEE